MDASGNGLFDQSQAAPYPRRRQFFAMRFIRLITRVALANEFGPAAHCLLTVVVSTEDARKYTDAATFFDHQLFPLVGLGSADTLARLRHKLVLAGWLHYERGRRARAARYWVSIPARYENYPDGHGCHDPAETEEPPQPAGISPHPCGNNSQNGKPGAENTTAKLCGLVRGSTAEKLAPLLYESFPVPIPNKNPPDPPEGGPARETPAEVPPSERRNPPDAGKSAPIPDGEPPHSDLGTADPPDFTFPSFWRVYPRQEGMGAALAAWRKLCPPPGLIAEILAAVEKQKQSDAWRRGYVPYPGKWLRDECWTNTPFDPARLRASAGETLEQFRARVEAARRAFMLED